jgi:hypothetical protein
MKNLGIILIVAGLLLAVYTSTLTAKEEILPSGTIELKEDELKEIHWWPITGLVISGVGIVVVWFNSKRKKNSVRTPNYKEDEKN